MLAGGGDETPSWAQLVISAWGARKGCARGVLATIDSHVAAQVAGPAGPLAQTHDVAQGPRP